MSAQVAVTAAATMIIQMALNQCGTEFITAFAIGTRINNIITQVFGDLGMGDGRVTLWGGLCELAARGVVVLFLAEPFGYYGICYGHALAWTAALIPLIPYYYRRMSVERRRKDKEKRVTVRGLTA